MHPDNCNMAFGTGTLYINGEEFGGIIDANVTYAEDFGEAAELVRTIGATSSEFSCTIKMATDEFVRLSHALLGIDKALAESCPNKRVVHLAHHAKKKRIRKKNYNRMIRMCERYA